MSPPDYANKALLIQAQALLHTVNLRRQTSLNVMTLQATLIIFSIKPSKLNTLAYILSYTQSK